MSLFPKGCSPKRDARCGPNHQNFGSWVLRERRRRTNRATNKLSAAIGAYEAELPGRALFAIRAFECADVSFMRIGRKIPVAAFTVRSQFE